MPFAHRGLHGPGIPENTLAAFEAAARAGIAVELDVHRSRDGVPVVVHDRDLRRMADRPHRVAEVDARELGGLRLAGSDHGVPALADALEILEDVPVMVELKNMGVRPGLLEPAVAALLARHPGAVCVASFNPRTLTWFRDRAPDMLRVQTAGTLDGVVMPGPVRWSLRTLRWLGWTRPAAVSYAVAGLHLPSVQAYRAAGGTVLAWTVMSEGDLARARDLADNVIFESLPVADVMPSGMR